jgi:nitrogen fixation NifU-like protein|tara:strand:- start:3127 stop:3549 length:423 start_codon:yes stop_codon:yes gene_type:complete
MEQIYQDRILAFARAARDATPLENATHRASVSNPTCGDRVDISLIVEGDRIRAVSAAVRGCALCEAGAGLLMGSLDDMPLQTLDDMRADLTAWLGGEDKADINGDVAVFEPVRAIRNRHKCVTLAFEAGVKALSADGDAG